MEQAPAWLSYVSPAIALLALFVSLATYRRAGPRVRVRANAPFDWEPGNPDLEISIIARNAGLAPVQVVGIRLGVDYFGVIGMLPSLDLTNSDRFDGPELKVKLENGHQLEWTFDAVTAMKRQFGDNYEKFPHSPPDLLTQHGSVGLAARGFARMLLGIPIMKFGVIAVVDLGNGVQVYSRPMFRLTLKLLPYLRYWLREAGGTPLPGR